MEIVLSIYLCINVCFLIFLVFCGISLSYDYNFDTYLGFNWKWFVIVPVFMWLRLKDINRTGKTILIILWSILGLATQILNIVFYIIFLLIFNICLAYKIIFKENKGDNEK